MNKRYVFLMAWMHGSEGEENNLDGEHTNVERQEDLMIEFRDGNELVFVAEIFAPNEAIADAIGYRAAFFDGFTAEDTLSVLEEITTKENLTKIRTVSFPRFTVKGNKIIETEGNS